MCFTISFLLVAVSPHVGHFGFTIAEEPKKEKYEIEEKRVRVKRRIIHPQTFWDFLRPTCTSTYLVLVTVMSFEVFEVKAAIAWVKNELREQEELRHFLFIVQKIVAPFINTIYANITKKHKK